MKSDIEIARSIELTKIKQIAREYGIPVEEISNYGRYIAAAEKEIGVRRDLEGRLSQAEMFVIHLFVLA